MAGKRKKNKSANVTAVIYDGQEEIYYDCISSGRCSFALFPIMPPAESDECTYKGDGTCMSRDARRAALEVLHSTITALLKENDEEDQG